MQGAKRSITSRVTIKNPRPRKYASAAEKQAAFRARFPTICVRVEPKTADTVQAIADASGRTQQETLLSMLKYAMTNRNWLTLGLTEHKQLPRIEEPRKENPMKRKPSPAQIAARERFAAMARSGAFKKKAAKAKAKPKRNPMIISKQADESLSPKGSRGYVRQLLDRYAELGHVVSVKKTRSGSIGIAFDGGRLLTVASARKKLEDFFGITETMKRRSNPRASNPIILVSDKAIATKRKRNPTKPKKQRMLNISWITAGGQRDMMSVPIDFVFTHYVGNVAERFFVRTENGQLIVSEYSTGGRVGQVPYTMRAEARNDREAAKRYVGEMLSRIGAERFKAAVKKFDPIN